MQMDYNKYPVHREKFDQFGILRLPMQVIWYVAWRIFDALEMELEVQMNAAVRRGDWSPSFAV